jgi:hypothetical protein
MRLNENRTRVESGGQSVDVKEEKRCYVSWFRFAILAGCTLLYSQLSTDNIQDADLDNDGALIDDEGFKLINFIFYIFKCNYLIIKFFRTCHIVNQKE